MQQLKAVRELAAAAGQLSIACDGLMGAGYGRWSSEIKMLMDIIDAEIDWLRDHERAAKLAGP